MLSIRKICRKILRLGLENRGHWISYEPCRKVNLAMWLLAKKGFIKLVSNKQFMII